MYIDCEQPPPDNINIHISVQEKEQKTPRWMFCYDL